MREPSVPIHRRAALAFRAWLRTSSATTSGVPTMTRSSSGSRIDPRAAAVGDRRADLVALLDDFEWTQRAHPQPADMDLDRVRRDLGLA